MRGRIATAAVAIWSLGLNILLQKGWLDWIPTLVVLLLLFAPVCTWIWLGLTHDRFRSFLRKQGPIVSVTIFILVGAIIGGACGGVLYKVLSRPGIASSSEKKPQLLTVSIQDFGYDDAKHELEALAVFTNKDADTRIVLSVVFFYKTKDQRVVGRNDMKVFQKDSSRKQFPFQMVDDPVYVSPGKPEVRKFRQKVDPGLLKQEGNVFGLIITTLNANGSRNVSQFELMDLMGGLGLTKSGAPARAFVAKGVMSLDEPWQIVPIETRQNPDDPKSTLPAK